MSVSAEWIGWASTGILVATVGRQTYTQWKSNSTAGVSRWLYIGQMFTSAGYVLYSALLQNWVFVASNAFLLVIAAAGQIFLLRSRKGD